MGPSYVQNRRAAISAIALLAIGVAASVAAHDIPADATLRIFIKPEGQRLHLLVRVPMASINDIDWPTRQGGDLDLSRIEPFLRDASTLWIADDLDLYEGDAKLAYPTVVEVRLSTEGDSSFTSYDDALAHVSGPRIPDDTSLQSTQGTLDVLFDYAISSQQSRFSLHPKFNRLGLRVLTILRFVSSSGTTRAFEYEGGDPGLLRLDPEWHHAAWKFTAMGFRNVLGGIDHLLFLFCGVILFRRFSAVVLVASAFLVACSTTLIASAYGMTPAVSWFPALIDTLVATSIIYAAVENVVGLSLSGTITAPRRALVVFAFGLVHGFGFSFALEQTLQFAGSHFLLSVLSFDLGIGLGTAAALALFIPAINLLFRVVVAERLGTIILSALGVHTGWHWLTTRAALLWRYQFTWPELSPAFFAEVLRWMMLAVAIASILWLGSLFVKSSRLSRSWTP